MILARVLGNVVATQKNSRYGDARIMLVQPINPDGSPQGSIVWGGVDGAYAKKPFLKHVGGLGVTVQLPAAREAGRF